ncbi:TPA: hypothetical protein MND73_004652 [Salmonella enterica subsp. houtenae]|nr:hypothetical protein [Salmonella enterica subsp. houtenae]
MSIICLEDKTVQEVVVTVLNQTYEADFLGFAYGFRPSEINSATGRIPITVIA